MTFEFLVRVPPQLLCNIINSNALKQLHVFKFYSVSIQTLVEKPQDLLAPLGASVTFKCRSSEQTPLAWKYLPPDSNVPNNIFFDRTLVRKYTRYTVNSSLPGQCDLTIRCVTKSDVGRFKCSENDGMGTEHVVASLGLKGKKEIFCCLSNTLTKRQILNYCACLFYSKTLVW